MDATRIPWDDPEAEGGRLDGWAAWALAVRALLSEAAAHPTDLFLFDDDYTRWPLGEAGCVDSLEHWALSGRARHLTLLARQWDAVPRQHPRWVRWRAPWGHRVSCKSLPENEESAWQTLRPMMVLKDRLGIELLDTEHGIGHWSRRPATLQEWWRSGDAISQRSVDALPVTTLGL